MSSDSERSHQRDRDQDSSRYSSPASSSDDDSVVGMSSRGLGRFRENDRLDSMATAANVMEENGIANFCTESLYSYSFAQIPHAKMSRNRKHLLSRGNDYIQRIRKKLSDRDPGRRFSQPDIGAIDKLRLHASTWSSQNTPRTSIDYGNSKLFSDVLARHMENLQENANLLSGASMVPSSSTKYPNLALEPLDHTLPPIDEASLTPSVSRSCVDRYRKALHVPTRFLPQNQAMVTTDADGTIMVLNDITCLCFGIDKSFIGKSLLDALEEPFRTQISRILEMRKRMSVAPCNISMTPSVVTPDNGIVIVCGTVVPIAKVNGVKSVASLWLKEKKTEIGNRIYIWIFEEIYESTVSACIDTKGIIRSISGAIQELYEYNDSDVVHQPISMLIPSLSKEDSETQAADIRMIQQERFCGSRAKSGVCFPTLIRLQDDKTEHILTITSLPTIAGLITVHADNGIIQSTNPVPSKYLFGYSPDALVHQMNIATLLPRFPAMINGLRELGVLQAGIIVDQHACRDALSTPVEQVNGQTLPHIYAVHRDGSIFEVQLQLRLIENERDALISIWVTYDRIHALSKRHKRKASETLPTSTVKEPENRIVVEEKGKDPPSQHAMQSSKSYQMFSFGDKRSRCTDASSCFGDSEPPAVLSDYIIVDTLGTGTYGTAKLAYRKDDEKETKIVIKYIVKSRIIVDSWIRDRQLGILPLEIHIMRKLAQHPHINCCGLITHLEDDDNYYAVMKAHGDGMDLFDYIELNENMTEREIRSIFRQVVKAIQHLHQLHVVHRDIKDENILLNDHGTVQLIDFGSAAYFRPGRPFDTFSGTLDYCAPEILKGMSYEGPPQDIWSLGILLYTLIYRETPFYNIDEILERELRIPHVPFPDLMQLLQRMLSRDVDQRPTIDDVINDPWLNQP